METYASGKGHVDLANRLQIPRSYSLAIGGSANTRIIRTTLKHSYETDCPTLYVLGMTFLSRLEIPILENQNEFEGRWTNPQNQDFVQDWQSHWTQQDTDRFVELKLKSEIHSILDRVEDLMYRLVSLISDLHRRGHKVLVYQQADNLYQGFLEDSRLKLFQQPEFVGGYAWQAIVWQHNQGVPATRYQTPVTVPADMMHRESGAHQKLNEYLYKYIQQHNILGETHDLESV